MIFSLLESPANGGSLLLGLNQPNAVRLLHRCRSGAPAGRVRSAVVVRLACEMRAVYHSVRVATHKPISIPMAVRRLSVRQCEDRNICKHTSIWPDSLSIVWLAETAKTLRTFRERAGSRLCASTTRRTSFENTLSFSKA